MKLKAVRAVDPPSVHVEVDFDQADLEQAFSVVDGERLELFWSLFSTRWTSLDSVAKLAIISRLAGLAQRATSLGLVAGQPTKKE